MNKFIAIIVTFSLTACELSTEYGNCKGFLNNNEEQANLIYEISGRNVFWGFVGSETLAVPLAIAAFCYHCPVAKRK